MYFPLALSVIAVGASATGPTADDPLQLLAQRNDGASASWVVAQLEAGVGAHPADATWTEALLRARKFLADGLSEDDTSNRLHRRNIEDGLALLSASAGRPFDDFGQLASNLGELPASMTGVLYWTALSFGRTIPSRSVFARPGAAKDFRRVLAYLVEREPGYFHGGPLRAIAMYDLSAPGIMGGSDERAVRHALEALRRSPDFAPNRLVLARVAMEQGRGNGRIVGLLEGALEAPTDLPADAEPEHQRAREEALRILEDLR